MSRLREGRANTARGAAHLVANAGLLLPATLARHLGLRELVDHHLDLGGPPGRANTGDKMLTRVASALAVSFSCDSRDVIRVCEPCQGFVRRCKRCRRFHLVYQGQGGEYSMPWWGSESWLKEHGCTRRDFGDVPIPFVWMPAGSEPPNV